MLEVILYILEDVTYHAYCKLYLIVRVNLLDFNFLNASFKIYQCKYVFLQPPKFSSFRRSKHLSNICFLVAN